jgi:putative ABC transport system permease protein
VLHRNILVAMGQIAGATAVPGPFFDVYRWALLGALLLAGAGIALLGALLPAQWAARSRVRKVLQAE